MTWSEHQCDEDWTGLTRIFHVSFVNRDSSPMAMVRAAVRWLQGWFICSNSWVWVSWRLDWDPFWVQPFIILFFSILINSAPSLRTHVLLLPSESVCFICIFLFSLTLSLWLLLRSCHSSSIPSFTCSTQILLTPFPRASLDLRTRHKQLDSLSAFPQHPEEHPLKQKHEHANKCEIISFTAQTRFCL